jgi:hypothetical protein
MLKHTTENIGLTELMMITISLEQNVTAKPRKSSRKKGVKIPGKILLR